jgi:hypothetical protein
MMPEYQSTRFSSIPVSAQLSRHHAGNGAEHAMARPCAREVGDRRNLHKLGRSASRVRQTFPLRTASGSI